MTLQRNVALVTGATRGIGAACASQLAQTDTIVIGTATTAQGVKQINARLAPLGGAGRILDITDSGAIEALVASVEQTFGPIVILVNNAGITRDNLLIRMKEEDWDAIMDTNLKSVFRVSKAVLRGMMKARFGRLINIASVVGCTGNPGQANYVAAKAGIIGFTKTVAQEVGSRNITVNCIAPGFIDTDMTRALSEAQREALTRRITLGRLGTVDDVAAAVTFLASERANYITGQTLHVNGGLWMP